MDQEMKYRGLLLICWNVYHVNQETEYYLYSYVRAHTYSCISNV